MSFLLTALQVSRPRGCISSLAMDQIDRTIPRHSSLESSNIPLTFKGDFVSGFDALRLSLSECGTRFVLHARLSVVFPFPVLDLAVIV